MEHYRLGSTRAILSRSFCNTDLVKNIDEIDKVFEKNIKDLRNFEDSLVGNIDFSKNHEEVKQLVDLIVKRRKGLK